MEEYVVWSRNPNEPEWMESVNLETKNLAQAEHRIDCLRSNGMIARLMVFNPSRAWNASAAFAGTVRK